MPSRAYDFRPMSAADLPLLHRWLASAQASKWWGTPAEQVALISAEAAEPSLEQDIVAIAGRPFTCRKCYDVAAWPGGGFGRQPPGAAGVAPFIGEADMLDRGHGSALIGPGSDRLLAAGCPRVLSDPDPANARAIRADRRDGLTGDGEVTRPERPALLLICDNNRTLPA